MQTGGFYFESMTEEFIEIIRLLYLRLCNATVQCHGHTSELVHHEVVACTSYIYVINSHMVGSTSVFSLNVSIFGSLVAAREDQVLKNPPLLVWREEKCGFGKSLSWGKSAAGLQKILLFSWVERISISKLFIRKKEKKIASLPKKWPEAKSEEEKEGWLLQRGF